MQAKRTLFRPNSIDDIIASWLSDHADKDTRYVIIDDEYVIFDSQYPHFLLTNPYDGITEDIVNRAIAILNG